MTFRILLEEITEMVRQTVLENTDKTSAREIIKENRADVTRRIDDIIEYKVINYLKKTGYSTLIISEELGVKKIGEKPEIIIIMDPLDGTYNFVRSIPFYSVSIAIGPYRDNPTIDLLSEGAVKDIPNGDLYYAHKGQGVYLNGRRIIKDKYSDTVSNRKNHNKPIIDLYIYGSKPYIPSLKLLKKYNTRTLGSLALELCYIAMSKIDALIDFRSKLRLVDIAAGLLIVEEAGGIVRRENGKRIEGMIKDTLFDLSIIAARNIETYNLLFDMIQVN